MQVVHVKKSRSYHQITAAVLHSLLIDAYTSENPESCISLQEWIDQNASSSPTFRFWLLVLNLEVLLLSFVKSVRMGNYEDFKDALKSMIQWYFVFDHHNYARWLSVHIRDLEELISKAPSVHNQFMLG